MESFTITLAQVAPVVLDVEKNMKRALSLLDDCGNREFDPCASGALPFRYEIKEAISTEAGAERLTGTSTPHSLLLRIKTGERLRYPYQLSAF